MIAFVAATPSIDRLHEIEALRPGTIHRPERMVVVPGGKALNAARAAHALGGRVRAVTLLGGHAGRWIAAALADEGIEVEPVAGPGETRMSLSVAAGGPLTEFNASEAAELGVGDAQALRAAAGGGDRVAAITRGADGIELATPDGRVARVAPPALGPYPVGSGDAALGGFLTALDVGGDWTAALALATGAAAANAEVAGAGRLDGARAAALALAVRAV